MHSTQPNRSDLRWDSILEPHLSSDSNEWLATLNHGLTEEDAARIITYYGYIDPDGEDRLYWENPFQIVSSVLYIKLFADDHTKLTIASAIMDAGLSEKFPLNDGMVPIQSAAFDGHSVAKQVECPGHDHLDMKEYSFTKECSNNKTLFSSLTDDLLNLVPGIEIPFYINAPSKVTFKPKGPFPQGTTFDFSIDGPAVEKLDNDTFVFRKPGGFDITMRFCYPGGTCESVTDYFSVYPPEIDVDYPEDHGSYEIKLSTPHSDYVKTYLWNFGDTPENKE
jgi:hypothetical protein